MAPDVHRFPPSDLPTQIQFNAWGKKRKPPVGTDTGSGAARTTGDIDLARCGLFTMSQYECDVLAAGEVHCYEVVRYFRKCADRKGPFTVETTLWETQQSVAKAMSEQSNQKNR